MISEIGSNFWLNPNQQFAHADIGTPKQFNCDGEDYVWLSTGRSAIKFVIKSIEERDPDIKKVAVLPSFTCDTVFEPFNKAGYEVYYYPVGKDLRTTSEAIMGAVLSHDASILLFHRYFGFNTLDGHIDEMCGTLRSLRKYTIEDCTQVLYSNIPRPRSDYMVGSIRKWTGTPDGGFAVCRKGVFKNKPICVDRDLELAKVKASYAKYHYLFDHMGDKETMLAMYRKAEDLLDNQKDIYAISDTSARVQANLNQWDLKCRRRENFALLSANLLHRVKPMFSLGNIGEVPLYFPILIKDRAIFQRYLVSHSIYAPVVWPKDKNQPTQCDGAENAYQHLLCIPIDQRYDADDMNRIVEVINGFYG